MWPEINSHLRFEKFITWFCVTYDVEAELIVLVFHTFFCFAREKHKTNFHLPVLINNPIQLVAACSSIAEFSPIRGFGSLQWADSSFCTFRQCVLVSVEQVDSRADQFAHKNFDSGYLCFGHISVTFVVFRSKYLKRSKSLHFAFVPLQINVPLKVWKFS